ncbi:hypothetical protein NORO109296_26230 [Nocardiopsis rhodophaea]
MPCAGPASEETSGTWSAARLTAGRGRGAGREPRRAGSARRPARDGGTGRYRKSRVPILHLHCPGGVDRPGGTGPHGCVEWNGRGCGDADRYVRVGGGVPVVGELAGDRLGGGGGSRGPRGDGVIRPRLPPVRENAGGRVTPAKRRSVVGSCFPTSPVPLFPHADRRSHVDDAERERSEGTPGHYAGTHDGSRPLSPRSRSNGGASSGTSITGPNKPSRACGLSGTFATKARQASTSAGPHA